MKKIILLSLIMVFNPVFAFDLQGITPVNPLDERPYSFKQEIKVPSFELKKATLSANDTKNQYTIAMDKFMQSNVRSSYRDFQVLIDSINPNDYVYMKLTKDMASIGFFNLAELAMSKIQDDDIANLMEEDVRAYYFPSYKLTHHDQIYLAEIYSNIMYNDQSKEATNELSKQTTLLMESDYANYLAAFGSLKNNNIDQAKKYINSAISKNPKNINYKRLRAEILSQSQNPKEGLLDLKSNSVHTVVFDKELHSAQEYILYKSSKNDYLKKYHLAYYYYDKDELNKSLRTLQASVSGKKSINKDVYSLTAKVYYDLKEYEKAQDYALKSLAIDPAHTMALSILGDIAYRNSDYKLAQNYYKKAGKDIHCEVRLAQTYQKLNNSKKAREIYENILKRSSNAYEAYYEMALLDKDRELTYLKKSVAINPNFTDGWIDLARCEITKENFDTAMSFLDIVKYIDEVDFRYYYYFGLVLKNKGLISEAGKNFKKSLELNPDYGLAKEELNI
ncbi:tetratricopeptide repeat protein [bacterium]|nr:tetratricopeptide repeat protein [bacterium]